MIKLLCRWVRVYVADKSGETQFDKHMLLQKYICLRSLHVGKYLIWNPTVYSNITWLTETIDQGDRTWYKVSKEYTPTIL